MARIRYLKPDFFNDEDLAEHPFWIRLLFQGLWTIADKEGRLEDRPKRIKVDLFPYDNADVDKGLSELAKIKNHSIRPFIQRYEVAGEKYIAIVNWHKHQRPHHTEKESVIPEPPVLKIMEKGMGMGKQDEGSTELRNGELTVKKPLKTISDEDFINSLKTNQVYKGIDIDKELEKMDRWFVANPTRQKTRKFILRWLSKSDKTIETKKESKFKPVDPNCPTCKGIGFVYNQSISKNEFCHCRIKEGK